MFDFPPGTLPAFGLYLIRTSALIMSAPLLGQGAAFSGHKVGLMAGLSLLLYEVGGHPLPDLEVLHYGALALRELAIGLFLGFVLQLFMVSVRVAGELIGHEMGFAMAGQVDPNTGIQTPLVTRIYENFFFLGLLAVDGHLIVIRTLDRSYARAPIGELRLGDGMMPLLKQLLGQMFESGMTFAAPVMVLMALVSMLLGLLARTVPQLNVLELGFTLRIAIALLAMLLFAPLLAPVVGQSIDALLVWLDRAIEVTGD